MTLSVGDRLASYEILAPIGAGGMGEVYRARDTKLKRDVALKVLPEAFARDPERMARFSAKRKSQHSRHLRHYRRPRAGDGVRRGRIAQRAAAVR